MALDRDIERLSRVPFFETMDLDALRLVAFAAETRVLRSGDVLFRRGQPADAALLVMSGEIALEAPHLGPAAETVLSGPGTLLAEQALLTPVDYPVTAIAREPSSVLKISRTVLFRVLQEYPANALRIRSYWAARLGGKVEAVRRAIAQ